MRGNVKRLCVTNWNAVLELVSYPYTWETQYLPYRGKIVKRLANFVTVADPDAVDAGMVIRLDEIKLVARFKHWNNDQIPEIHATRP